MTAGHSQHQLSSPSNEPRSLYPVPPGWWIGLLLGGILFALLAGLRRQWNATTWWSDWELLFAHAWTAAVAMMVVWQAWIGYRFKSQIDEPWFKAWIDERSAPLANPELLFTDLQRDFFAIEREWNRRWQIWLVLAIPVSLAGFMAFTRRLALEEMTLETRFWLILIPVVEFNACAALVFLASLTFRRSIALSVTKADSVVSRLYDTGKLADMTSRPAIKAYAPITSRDEKPDKPTIPGTQIPPVPGQVPAPKKRMAGIPMPPNPTTGTGTRSSIPARGINVPGRRRQS